MLEELRRPNDIKIWFWGVGSLLTQSELQIYSYVRACDLCTSTALCVWIVECQFNDPCTSWSEIIFQGKTIISLFVSFSLFFKSVFSTSSPSPCVFARLLTFMARALLHTSGEIMTFWREAALLTAQQCDFVRALYSLPKPWQLQREQNPAPLRLLP